MSADHLTTTIATPREIADAVAHVLSGADINAVAAATALDPVDLADAVTVYQAAGTAALEQREENEWQELRVRFTDWQAAEITGATRLGPALDKLQTRGDITDWWFLRKYPYWRVRARPNDRLAFPRTLDELRAEGMVADWSPALYEPELQAFGGPNGINTIHNLFCADSHGTLAYLRHQPDDITTTLGRRELSLLLLNTLMHAANLDTFERGDVFARVAQHRPTPNTTDTSRIDHLAQQLLLLLAMPDPLGSEPIAHQGNNAYLAPWVTAFRRAGEQLGTAATHGDLHRGLRAVLTHIVIFHWNRLGLTTNTQAILARAATNAMLPPN